MKEISSEFVGFEDFENNLKINRKGIKNTSKMIWKELEQTSKMIRKQLAKNFNTVENGSKTVQIDLKEIRNYRKHFK